VLVPVPRVYVKTVSLVGDPDGASDGAGPLFPVERAPTGDVSPPAADFVAENEECAAELADAASATGQTVVVRATVSVTTDADARERAGQSVTVGAQLYVVWV